MPTLKDRGACSSGPQSLCLQPAVLNSPLEREVAMLKPGHQLSWRQEVLQQRQRSWHQAVQVTVPGN